MKRDASLFVEASLTPCFSECYKNARKKGQNQGMVAPWLRP